MEPGLEQRLRLAVDLADLSARRLRADYRCRAQVEDKADGTLVSGSDRAVEQVLRREIQARFPGDGILGEEFGAERPEARWQWVLDPIDGTRAFLAGLPTFVTLIAALEDGRPRLGVIDQPIVGDRWVAAHGAGTRFGEHPARTRPVGRLDRALLATTDPFLFPAAERPALEALSHRTRARVTGGDGMLYGLLAGGHVDLVVESGLAWHDVAAVVPVVREAGGWIGTWEGDELEPSRCSRVLAAGDPSLVEEVRRVLLDG